MIRKLAGFGFAFAMAELAAVCLPPLAVLLTAAFVVFTWFLLCLRRGRNIWNIPVFLGILVGGAWALLFRAVVVSPQVDLAGTTVTAQAVVQTDAETSFQDGSLRGTLHLTEINGTPCSIRVSCSAFPAGQPGDRFEGTFILQEILSDQYRQSWFADGVYLEAEYQGGYTALPPSGSWLFWLYRLRERLSGSLCVWMPSDLGGMEAAMLLGDKSRLSQTVEESFRTAGVSHMLAISGLHLSLLCGLFSAGGKRRRFFRPYLAVQACLTLFYIALTGFSVSVLRAGVIYFITLLGYALLQPPDLLTSLGLAAVFIGLPNAYAPCDMGFQLSFCGVLGVQLGAALARWQRKYFLPAEEIKAATWSLRAMEILLHILEAVETTALASLATLPVLLVHGLSAGGAAVPANLLTVWMLRPALVLGLLVLLAAALPFLGPLHHLLSLVLSVWLSWMYGLVQWCAGLPMAKLYLPRRYTVFVWCVLAVMGLIFWARKHLVWYFPAAAACLALAVVLGLSMQAGVLRVLMVGTAGNACTVLIQDGQAAVLFRGGAANLHAVEDCLAGNGDPEWCAVIDMRQESDAMEFPEAASVIRASQSGKPVISATLMQGITADCFCSASGVLCVVQEESYRIGVATGQPHLPTSAQVDLFCAGGSLPDDIAADVVMTNTLSPRWLDDWAGSLLFAGEEPAAIIRPGKSIIYEEGKAIAVQ